MVENIKINFNLIIGGNPVQVISKEKILGVVSLATLRTGAGAKKSIRTSGSLWLCQESGTE